MKIILIDTQESINVSSLKETHVVVLLHNRRGATAPVPYLLTAGDIYSPEGYYFLRLHSPMHSAGQAKLYRARSMQTCVKQALESEENLHAFADWQEAFKWLLENTK